MTLISQRGNIWRSAYLGIISLNKNILVHSTTINFITLDDIIFAFADQERTNIAWWRKVYSHYFFQSQVGANCTADYCYRWNRGFRTSLQLIRRNTTNIYHRNTPPSQKAELRIQWENGNYPLFSKTVH